MLLALALIASIIAALTTSEPVIAFARVRSRNVRLAFMAARCLLASRSTAVRWRAEAKRNESSPLCRQRRITANRYLPF
jgi:hypothetical protein